MTDTHSPGAWHQTSPTITKIAPALVVAQAEIGNVVKQSKASTGTYEYSYADLGSVISHVRSALLHARLTVMQTAETDGDDVLVWTTILHDSGEFIMSRPLRLPAGKTVQQTGSAITYGRRYALLAMLLIGTEDDDGASAAPRADRTRRTPATITPAPAPARTPEEQRLRELLADLQPVESRAIRDSFRATFGTTLAALEIDRHAEALAWVEERIVQVTS